MKKKLSDIGEFGLIDLIKKGAVKGRGVIKGIGDDAAVVSAGAGRVMLLTTDILVEKVHFTRAMDPVRVGQKAMACNVSDIAAMGGVPKYAVVSLGVPANLPVRYVEKLYHGMNQVAQKFGVSIVGGDTVSSRALVINVALTGEARWENVVYRSGAREGEWIFVTGPLGRSFSTGKHLTFTPRVKEAQWLVRHFKPSAMIDISDGLAADLGHVLDDSGVGAVLEEKKIPRTPGARLDEALYDGEDFELLFTLAPAKAMKLMARVPAGMHFYPVGMIVGKTRSLTLLDQQGKRRPLARRGYTHF